MLSKDFPIFQKLSTYGLTLVLEWGELLKSFIGRFDFYDLTVQKLHINTDFIGLTWGFNPK